MGLFINTNQSALTAQRKLTSATSSLSTSFERLSSGLRINSAKDDAAGLSISTRFTSQVRGLNQAVRNSNDGISLAQTAEGALNETGNILQRIRELAVQAANDTNNSSDRASIQAEVDQLVSELDRIADTTTFNGNKLLDGNFLSRNIQVGANVGETLSVSVEAAGTKDLARQARYDSDNFVAAATIGTGNTLSFTKGGNSFSIRSTVAADDGVSTTFNSSSAIAKAAAINDSSASSGVRAIVGETTVEGNQAVAAITLNETNYVTINDQKISGFGIETNDASGSLVDAINAVSNDTGVVASLNESSELVLTAADGRNIQVEFSTEAVAVAMGDFENAVAATFMDNGATFQGVIATGKITLQSNELFEIGGSATNVGFTTAGVYGVNSDFSVNTLDLSTREGAVTALDIVDLAIEDVSSSRAALGALQNRLQSTINNLSTTAENLSASRSRIQDADFAAETAALSRNQIIQQAGVSILAQANQQPQIALALIG